MSTDLADRYAGGRRAVTIATGKPIHHCSEVLVVLTNRPIPGIIRLLVINGSAESLILSTTPADPRRNANMVSETFPDYRTRWNLRGRLVSSC